MTKITGQWLTSEATQRVTNFLSVAGFQALFVGGCVRNALLSEPVNDIDMSTDARPDQVMKLAQDAGLKAVPTGIDHGTITVISNRIPHEITTFRTDVSTDGRHAEIVFSTDIEDDAVRRDFTMNALYATSDGTVLDPVNGLPDLLARRVRFVGVASARITEDYLRILRFFRFHAWYGDPAEGIDPEGLAACAQALDGIDALSRERIGAEMVKLLAAPDPAPSVAAMAKSGVLHKVMPGADPKALAPLIHFESTRPPDWRRRAAVLGGDPVGDAWRLSKKDALHLIQIRKAIEDMTPVTTLAYETGAAVALNTGLARAAIFEVPVSPSMGNEIALGDNAVFPIKAADLPNFLGRELGQKLKALEATWVASNFTMDKEALLAL